MNEGSKNGKRKVRGSSDNEGRKAEGKRKIMEGIDVRRERKRRIVT